MGMQNNILKYLNYWCAHREGENGKTVLRSHAVCVLPFHHHTLQANFDRQQGEILTRAHAVTTFIIRQCRELLILKRQFRSALASAASAPRHFHCSISAFCCQRLVTSFNIHARFAADAPEEAPNILSATC